MSKGLASELLHSKTQEEVFKVVATWLDNKLCVQNVMKIGSKLTEESVKFIHPGQWIYC